MKRNQNRLWCLFLSAVMLFSLASCGKDGGKSSGDPNLIKLDDYELLYKSACIMADFEGKDALVLTLEERIRLLSEELRVTTQRVNLFEKVKIPEAQENIRVIGIYLQDQQTAAVVRGKIAKKKLVKVS